MKLLGNIIWLIFGGLEAAIGYFTGSLALLITIVGAPLAWQTFKLGMLCLWPFGSKVTNTNQSMGCLYTILDIVWLITGGIWACLNHVIWGALLCITIIGIPWGKQHFKMAGFALAPFGKDVQLGSN